MIRHAFDFDIGRGELNISMSGILGLPQLRFTTSSGDIYIGSYYSSSDHWDYMFKIEPMLEYVSSDVIDVVFKENYYGYPDVIVRLHRLSAEDVARQRVADVAADEIINYILTKRFIAGERSPILKKVR